MSGQQQRVSPPVYVLAAAVVLEIVAGVIAFLTDAPLVALVLCVVGLVCLGAAGDALRRPTGISEGRRAAGRR